MSTYVPTMKFWIVIAVAAAVVALDPAVCARYNTGSGSASKQDQWMSNGLCHDHCLGYAYAVTNGNLCWCSNYAPGDTVDIGECNQGCPGIDLEKCGGDNAFGYVKLPGMASGTMFDPSKSTSTTKPATLSAPPPLTTPRTTTSTSPPLSAPPPAPVLLQVLFQTLVLLVTLVVELVVTKTNQKTQTTTTVHTTEVLVTTTSTIETSEEPSLSDEPSLSTEPSLSSESSLSLDSSSSQSSLQLSLSAELSVSLAESSSLLGPTTVVLVMTVDGAPEVTTRFITTLPDAAATNATTADAVPQDHKKLKGFFDLAGKVAGTFTAVGVVVVALAALLLWCCCCAGRRSVADDDDYTDEDHLVVEPEKAATQVNYLNTPLSVPPAYSKSNVTTTQQQVRRLPSFSGMLGLMGANTSNDKEMIRSQSRKKLIPSEDEIIVPPAPQLDLRLDPLTMFLSQNLLQKLLDDDVDYSRRVLRVANPDHTQSGLSKDPQEGMS